MREHRTRADLDGIAHSTPQFRQDGFYFTASCHPKSGLKAHYLAGVLTVVCSECERVVTSVVVAPGKVVLHA